MPGKFNNQLFEDEEILLLFRKHPIVMRREIVVASVLLLLGILPAVIKPTFGFFFGGLAVGFILAFAVMFYAWIGWHFSAYIVTDQRLIQMTQKGLWQRSEVDIGLDKIQAISYQIKGVQETILGFGTIVVQTYVGELVIHNVNHPKKIQQRVSKILRELGYDTIAPPMMDKS
ncbi:PH domain-containing protein [Candidatus Saccharibacteria bacterium]|jgi:uncharacterized membrane protein YdbT with pleckstrin-like domain|nr:PH domain-containing protein [Candidatus Saccharibacteria bacterium]